MYCFTSVFCEAKMTLAVVICAKTWFWNDQYSLAIKRFIFNAPYISKTKN